MAPCLIEIQLVDWDPENAYLGLAVDGNNYLKVDVEDWKGSAVGAATAGVPDVNVKNISNAAVSTTSAQVGVNVVQYNGQTAATDGNNLPKVDVEDWKGGAVGAATAGVPDVNVKNISNAPVSTTSAQLGVNVVNIAGQAAALDGNNLLKVNVTDWNGTAVGALPTNFSSLVISAAGYVTLAPAGFDQVSIDGKTGSAALQYIAASVAGKVSGAGSGTETFKGLDGATTRLTVTVDASGNRSAISYA